MGDAQSAGGRRTRGVVLVALAGVLFSTLGLGVRLMEEATAWQIVFYRGLFQAVVITGIVWHRSRGGLREAFRGIGRPGVVGAVALAVAYNGMILALTLTSVATVVFVLGAAPLMSALLGWWILRERVAPSTFTAMAVALVGIFVMTAAELGDGRVGGLVAATFALLGYAVFTVSLRKGRDVDMLPAIALSGILAAGMSSLLIDGFAMTGRDLALSAYLGGVSLAGGLALFTAGSRDLTAAELPLVAMTEVVLAPVWVWWLLGETVGTATLLGGATVLVAVLVQAAAISRPADPRGGA